MKIVCFGDSLTACGGENGRFSDILADRFPRHQFINRGIGGETFEDALARIEPDVLAEHPDLVLIEFGANDWRQDRRPPREWARDLEAIVRAVRRAGAVPVVLGVFGPVRDSAGNYREKETGADSRSRVFRILEAQVAERHNAFYIPNIQERIAGDRCCWSDRNHPN